MHAAIEDETVRSKLAARMVPGSNTEMSHMLVRSLVALTDAFDTLRLRSSSCSNENFQRIFRWVFNNLKDADAIEFKYQAAESLGRAAGNLAPIMASEFYDFQRSIGLRTVCYQMFALDWLKVSLRDHLAITLSFRPLANSRK